jgi:GR25 family glycosyltransferase involved in LPS biosynthesis
MNFYKIVSLFIIVVVACIFGTYLIKNIIYEFFEESASIDYLDGIDVIYWINLDRSTDRRKHMENMFKDPVFNGKKIIRIKAVDGKSADIDNILNDNFENMNPELTKAEYACTLSHINAIRKFLKSDDKIALILEDDTTLDFKPYWKKTLHQIMKEAPNDWDIIQLNYISSDIPKETYTKNINTYYGTGSYILNKNNINKIISNKYVNLGADEYLFSILNTYVYKYPLFTYISNGNSTIHQDHVASHDMSKLKIEKRLQNGLLQFRNPGYKMESRD